VGSYNWLKIFISFRRKPWLWCFIRHWWHNFWREAKRAIKSADPITSLWSNHWHETSWHSVIADNSRWRESLSCWYSTF